MFPKNSIALGFRDGTFLCPLKIFKELDVKTSQNFMVFQNLI